MEFSAKALWVGHQNDPDTFHWPKGDLLLPLPYLKFPQQPLEGSRQVSVHLSHVWAWGLGGSLDKHTRI